MDHSLFIWSIKVTDLYTKTYPYACMSVLDLSAPQRLNITDCNPPVTIPWATPGIKINRHNSQKSVTQIGFHNISLSK